MYPELFFAVVLLNRFFTVVLLITVNSLYKRMTSGDVKEMMCVDALQTVRACTRVCMINVSYGRRHRLPISRLSIADH